jgi:hypothetical protein
MRRDPARRRRTSPVRCPECGYLTYNASGYCELDDPESLVDFEDEQPQPGGRAPTGEWFES